MSIDAAFGVSAAFLSVVMLRTDQHPQFPLDDTVVFMGVTDDFPAHRDVFLKRQVAAVDHDTGETLVDAFLAQFK